MLIFINFKGLDTFLENWVASLEKYFDLFELFALKNIFKLPLSIYLEEESASVKQEKILSKQTKQKEDIERKLQELRIQLKLVTSLRNLKAIFY